MEPYIISIPQDVLADLERRLRATDWPDDVDNEDWYYGINAQYLRDLVAYWIDGFQWRAVERDINAFDHYRTLIDDVPIHFMRVKGKGRNPLPLILTHGWPWTFWDMHRVARPLADPAAFGGDPDDTFDVIVPSLPGFGFSTPSLRGGMNFWKTADLWHRLMTEHLGFSRFAAAGGDWGALVTAQLGHKYAGSLAGIHMIQAVPLDQIGVREPKWDFISDRIPRDAPSDVRDALTRFVRPKASHFTTHIIDSQTLSYAMQDSPVGQLAWLLQRRLDWGDTHGDVESVFPRDHLLATSTLYWATKSFVSSVRYYADAARYPWSPAHDRQPPVEAPTGLTFLGGEFPPGVTMENRLDSFRASSQAAWFNLHYLNAHPTGGHFGHFENPEACIADIRATFRALR